MTDNAFTYVKNRSLRELLTAREIRHLTTQHVHNTEYDIDRALEALPANG